MNAPSNDEIPDLFRRLLEAILAGAKAPAFDGSFYGEIGPLVSQDDLEARSAEDLLQSAFRPNVRLLDFGCGAMHSKAMIESFGYRWSGIDYLESVSSSVRDEVARLHDEVTFYDGRTIPFADETFDVVWAMLVLHHVQSIDTSFSEMARVLKRGGKLIGQTAYLEQMQDYGTFNYTPYGMKIAAANAGLHLTKVYPKHDAFSFLLRRLIITFHHDDDTPLNQFMGPDGFYHHRVIDAARKLGLSVKDMNLLRLLFCTHYVFQIEKTE